MRIKTVNRKMRSPLKRSSWRGRRFISIFLTGRSIKKWKNNHWKYWEFKSALNWRTFSYDFTTEFGGFFTWSQLTYELSLKEYHRWRFLSRKRLKVQKTNMKKNIYSKAPPALHFQSFFVPWIKRSCLHFVADHWVLNWECYRIWLEYNWSVFSVKDQ